MALLNINPQLKSATQTLLNPNGFKINVSPSAPGSLAGGGLLNKVSSALSAPIQKTSSPFAYGNTNVPRGVNMLGVPQSNQLYGAGGVNVGIKAASPPSNIKVPSNTIAPKFTQDPNNPNFLSQSAGGAVNPVATINASASGSSVPAAGSQVGQVIPKVGTPQGIQDTVYRTNAQGQQIDANGRVISGGGISDTVYRTNAQGQQIDQNGNVIQGGGMVNLSAGGQGGQIGGGQNIQGAPGGLYGALIAGLASRGLQDSPEVQQARQALQQSQMSEANQLGLNALNPIPLEFQQGRAQVLQSQYAQQQAALANALGSATTTQGQQIGALQGAAGLAQPVSQFGMLTNPVTGQPLNQGVMGNALMNAYSMLQNPSTTWNDAVQASGLNQFGVLGTNALLNLMNQGGNGFSPSARNAAAGQNLQFGTQQQQISQNLSYGLQQLKALQPQATTFLNNSGMNPSNIPVWNSQINTYIANLKNPDTANTWNSIKNEIRGIAGQIVSAKQFAGTPTTNDEMTAAQDPGLLNGQQLTNVMNNWDTLGQIGLGVAQGNAQNLLGGNAYVGAPATQGNLVSGSNPNAYQNPTLQGIGGVFWNILSSPSALMSWISSIL